MDQNFSNNQTDFLWTLIADPAVDAQPYADKLQKLVKEYPQSGILQALFANSSYDKNLRQASVYFSPEALYKLINHPASFGQVPLDKIILKNGTFADTGYQPSVSLAANSGMTNPERSKIDPVDLQIFNSPAPVVTVAQVVESVPAQQFEPYAAPSGPINADVSALQPAFETLLNAAPIVADGELSIEQRIAKAINDAHHALQAHIVPEPEPALQPVTVNVSPESMIPVELIGPSDAGPGDPGQVTAGTVNGAPVHVLPDTSSSALAAEPGVFFSSDVVTPLVFEHQETPFTPQLNTPLIADALLWEANPSPQKTPDEEHFDAEAVPLKQADEQPFLEENAKSYSEDARFTTATAAAKSLPEKESEPARTDFFKLENIFGDHLSEPDTEAPASPSQPKQYDPLWERATTGKKAEHQNVAKYNDEKLPYTFLWWLNKTRREHAATYQPYVKQETPAPPAAEPITDKKTGDALQQQYFENIFHITSFEELDKKTEVIPRTDEPKKKEHLIIERFIKEEPQIRPQSSDKLDNENKAKKSSEDRDELVTETLAAIYAEQMLFHKAIAAYKKLMLKFPEKSRYFAAKIEQLEKKTN